MHPYNTTKSPLPTARHIPNCVYNWLTMNCSVESMFLCIFFNMYINMSILLSFFITHAHVPLHSSHKYDQKHSKPFLNTITWSYTWGDTHNTEWHETWCWCEQKCICTSTHCIIHCIQDLGQYSYNLYSRCYIGMCPYPRGGLDRSVWEVILVPRGDVGVVTFLTCSQLLYCHYIIEPPNQYNCYWNRDKCPRSAKGWGIEAQL